MKIYYVVGVVGLLDLRGVDGGYNTMKYAVQAAQSIIDKDGHAALSARDRKSKVGDWFSVHPSGGLVDGPYATAEQAEIERNVICKKYAQDANYDTGFIAKAVKVLGTMAVVARDYKP